MAAGFAKALFVGGLATLPPTKTLILASAVLGGIVALLDWGIRAKPRERSDQESGPRVGANPSPSSGARRADAPDKPASPNAERSSRGASVPPDVAAELWAQMQAHSKKADDANKARIRSHVERVKPPSTDSDRAALQLARGACLAIRHVFPPRFPQSSMSFLGGAPLGPDELDWPMIHNREGLVEPLTFMGQIDLGTVPPGPRRSILPEQGYLYFFAPMSGNFDASANHFVVRFAPGKAKKTWGPQHNPGFLQPIDGASNARYRFAWMNWRDKPSYPTNYPRVEVELGWIDDDDDDETGGDDAGGARGFPWEIAKQQHREKLIAFHGTPVRYDPVLSPAGKPVNELWIPYEGFPTNLEAAAILTGYLQTYLKEETDAINARLASLGDSTPNAGQVTNAAFEQNATTREQLESLLARYRAFENRHRAVLNQRALNSGDSAKPLSQDQKAVVLSTF